MYSISATPSNGTFVESDLTRVTIDFLSRSSSHLGLCPRDLDGADGADGADGDDIRADSQDDQGDQTNQHDDCAAYVTSDRGATVVCIRREEVSLSRANDDENDNGDSSDSNSNGGADNNGGASGESKPERVATLTLNLPDLQHAFGSKLSVNTKVFIRLDSGLLCSTTDGDGDGEGDGDGDGDGGSDPAPLARQIKVNYKISQDAPDSADSAPSANFTDASKLVPVYGLGVFVVDVSPGDLSTSQFYADVNVYVLKYYRDFDDVESAIFETTTEGAGRMCNLGAKTKKWFFLQNVTATSVGEQRLVQGINLGKFPRITPVIRGEDGRRMVDGKSDGGERVGELDHIRIQSEWYFAPSLIDFPFSSQSLPLNFELPGDTTSRSPSNVICWLNEYSGFSPQLSSFKTTRKSLDANFVVEETPHWPPFVSGKNSFPAVWPPPEGAQGTLMRTTSRLTMLINQVQHPAYSYMIIAPSIFIGLSVLITDFALPPTSFSTRLQCLTTALLSAVLQHSALRGRIPPQTGLTRADVIMGVIYLYITLSILSVGITSILSRQSNSNGLITAMKFHKTTRLIPLCSLAFLVTLLTEDPISFWGAIFPAFVCFVALIATIGYIEVRGTTEKNRRIEESKQLASRSSISGGSIILR